MCRLRMPTTYGLCLTSSRVSRPGRPTKSISRSYGIARIAPSRSDVRTSGDSRMVPADSSVTRGLPST